MKSHKRKILAPIIISVIIVLYYVIYFSLCSLTARNGYEVIFQLQQH